MQTANVVANYQRILTEIKKKNYISEIALSEKVKENYMYVREVLDELLKDSLIAEIGTQYSEKYNKLFKLYCATELYSIDAETKLGNCQYSAQQKAFCKAQTDIIRETGSNGAIKEALVFFTDQNAKIEIKYHALKRMDIERLYKLVISYGIGAEAMLDNPKPKKKK